MQFWFKLPSLLPKEQKWGSQNCSQVTLICSGHTWLKFSAIRKQKKDEKKKKKNEKKLQAKTGHLKAFQGWSETAGAIDRGFTSPGISSDVVMIGLTLQVTYLTALEDQSICQHQPHSPSPASYCSSETELHSLWIRLASSNMLLGYDHHQPD